MTREWIEPIYDRTYGNVIDAQQNPDQENPKGCWNDTDLRRIEKNTAYCLEWMIKQKIIRTTHQMEIHEEDDYWKKNIIPTKIQIDRVLNNVRTLVEISKHNPAIADQLPNIYAATQINYVLANQIEFALDIMHTQPKLPLDYFEVQITNGIITQIKRDDGTIEYINAASALVAEDEIVTIRGLEYGEHARYQTFTYWSAPAEDLALLEPNEESQEAVFKMPYRQLSFTANFETHLPRTLKLINGYISLSGNPREESGPNEGIYYAGDQIMIIANRAAEGKVFYEWLGTESATKNIVGVTDAEDPSTAWLTMPDEDVELHPNYINAGMHNVTVNYGTGSGVYDYKEHVSISANVPNHQEFAYWSGATKYLNDIYSSYQSFEMPDINIEFTAHFNYVYSYNDVQVINGKIRINGEDVNKATGLMQTSRQTLVPTPPDSSQGLSKWSIEGLGGIVTDNLGNQTNEFIVGDGNAIITAQYAPIRNLIVENVNNAGSSTTYRIVQGRKTQLSTNSTTATHIFTNWTSNGTVISSSTVPTITVPTTDTIITANYRLKNQVQVTINYGSHSETVTMTERATKAIVADAAPAGKHFSKWDYSGLWSINNMYSSSTTIYAGSGNGTVTAVFVDDIPSPEYKYHTLTVNGGTGSGSIRENYSTNIYANKAPATYEFDYWEINNGIGANISNIYNASTTFRMGTSDAEITAHYKPIPKFTVTMIDGYVQDDSGNWVESADILRNHTNMIKCKNAPTGYRFLQWEIYVDGVLQTNANDVTQPYAETTRLRNLTRNITLKATYYLPDPSVVYTLTLERKDGQKEINTYPVGTDVKITASNPDEGYVFLKWDGDTSYIAGGMYNSASYVHMPDRNIAISEVFVREGYIPEYELTMTDPMYGECCYETTYTDPSTGEITVTKNWTKKHSYPEGTEVEIRVINIEPEKYFSEWNAVNHETNEDARTWIKDLHSATTKITIPNYPVDCIPLIALREQYVLKVTNGYTAQGVDSASYRANSRADVYFTIEETDDDATRRKFKRWRGGAGTDITKIQLWNGGMFDVLMPGTQAEPQYIKMPDQHTELIADYVMTYRLELEGGTIDGTEGKRVEFYEIGTVKGITADEAPIGMKFQRWEGDIEYISRVDDPTTTVEITNLPIKLKAVYSTDEDRNDIGYAEMDLIEADNINNNDIHIIAGKIEVGFILTDISGHIYMITSVNTTSNTSAIYRMTKINKGGNLYG